MATKPGQSSQLDEWVVLESSGSENSPFEVGNFWIGVDVMVKIFLCAFFIKRKDTNTRTN